MNNSFAEVRPELVPEWSEKSNLCRRSAQIANLNCIEQKAFMGGTFQWNKNDRYVVSVLWSEG